MPSDEDIASEEDDDEWPDEYFDFDVELTPQILPSITDKLPMEILRLIVEPLGLRDQAHVSQCNRVLREAVVSSKWHCPILRCQVRSSQVLIHYFDHLNSTGTIFPIVHGLFAKLHLNELRLEYIPFDSDLLKPFNDFIDDGCTFDQLTFYTNPTLIDRAHQLMSRAKKAILLSDHRILTDSFIRSLRPVKIIFAARLPSGIPLVGTPQGLFPGETLKECATRGHSMIKFETEVMSTETLAEIIETVSSSLIRQKIDVNVLNSDVCADYLQIINATLVDADTIDMIHREFRGAIPPSGVYSYLGAKIHFHGISRMRNNIRIIATSKGYKESGHCSHAIDGCPDGNSPHHLIYHHDFCNLCRVSKGLTS